MPRFTLHRASSLAAQNAPLAESPQIPEGLKTDSRLQLLGELQHMVLIECPQRVAEEWLAKMPGWVLQPEKKAFIPDPRPKLKKRLK